MWASIVLALGVNLIGGKFLPRLENLVLILHLLGFLAILIPLTYMSDHKTAKEVFTTWTNEGGWSSNGIVFFLGMQGGVFAFAGGDAAVHVRSLLVLHNVNDNADCNPRWPKKSNTQRSPSPVLSS